ncbi:MAG: hypothetical protein DA330_06115 [Nitrososphaera sp.]|nr:hypothetical protein [Nitrososphaera sp.]
MWKVEAAKGFERYLRKLGNDELKRFDQAIDELANSNDPRKLGKEKQGNLKGNFTYEIGRTYRLLYKMNLDEKKIILLRYGTYKQVYGKD